MSRRTVVQAFVTEHSESGKRRIAVEAIKDEFLQVTFYLHAEQAEELAKTLLELAQTARGKEIIIPS